MPGIGGLAGLEPVAISSRSKRSVLPSPSATVRAVVDALGAIPRLTTMRCSRSDPRRAQVRALLVDVAHQQVRDRHARIRRLGLVADDHDVVVGRVLAQRLGGDHAGRAGAEDDVFHALLSCCQGTRRFTVNRLRSTPQPWRLQPELGARLRRQRAVGVPAARLVVLRQHLGQLVDQALGRAGLGRLRSAGAAAGVVLRGEAGAVVEVALHVPDALADQAQVLERELRRRRRPRPAAPRRPGPRRSW